ncbi:DnaJ domain-containing protein [Actinokineospora guangxiensis]|uniref:DnaJ domain-containing protein n=1 Tax=Actinokineospora guangxiensis TaxID=1490288 RepID=A0ABW0EKC7_9PSEU
MTERPAPERSTSERPAPERPAEKVAKPSPAPVKLHPKPEEVLAAPVPHLTPDLLPPTPRPPTPTTPFPRVDTTWTTRRDGATPTRFTSERFDPHSKDGGLHTADGQVSGRITQIRYDLRHFEVAPGKWVVEFTVPLDLVSPDGSVDAKARRGLADELQAELDKHFNHKHTWPGKGQFQGSQVHFTVDAATPNGVTRGWDADPKANVPVEIRAGDGKVNQVQWDAAAPVGSRLHEYFHFLGLGEGYTDPDLLFNRPTGRGGIMGDIAHKVLTAEQLGLIATLHEQSRPVASHSLADEARPAPAPAAAGPLVSSIASDGPYTAQHSPANAPKPDPDNPPRGGPEEHELRTLPPRGEPTADLNIPEYVRDNRGAGASEQKSVLVGADIKGGIARDVPALREHPMLQRIQDEVSTNVLSFLNESQRPPFRVVDGKNVYEVRPRTRPLWDKAEFVDPDAAPGEVKSKTDNKTWSNNTAGAKRDGSLNVQASYSATPPLVVAAKVGVPGAPSLSHDVTGQLKTTQSTEAETTGMRTVKVPVEVTYTVLDADGRTVAEITPGSERAITGTAEIAVPPGFTRADPDAGPVPVTALPKAPAVEELHSIPGTRGGFFEQTARDLPKRVTEIRSTGRGDLQEFLSDGNIWANWHKMAVTDAQLKVDPDAGWVRSKPLVKGPESGSWSHKASMVEMRAIARTVEVIQTLPDAKSTAHRFVKDTLTTSDSTSRGVDGTVTVVAGADIAGVVHAGIGPALGASATKSHTMQHSDKSLHKTSLTKEGEAVRYRTEHVLQVRPFGGAVKTLDGIIETFQSTSRDKAADAGLVPPKPDPTPITPDPSTPKPGNQGPATPQPTTQDPTTQSQPTQNQSTPTPSDPEGSTRPTPEADEQPVRYPPAHIVSGHSIGGAVVDDFRGGEALYRAVADTLRTLPGHKWYHLTRSDYVLEFGDAKLTSKYSRGLKASIERLLGRGDQLKKDLSGEHLSELVDTMLTDRGLSFTVSPKQATFQDYVTTVTLKATMDQVRGLGTPEDFTHVTDAKAKQNSKLTDEKTLKLDAGIRPRVWHPFSTTGHSHNGNLNITKSKAWTHTDELSGKSHEGTVRTHGDSVGEDGTVGQQKMWPFGARLTITPEVQSYVRTSPLLRKITIGGHGSSVPTLVEVKGSGDLKSHDVQLRVLVPEVLTSDTAPEALARVRPTDVRTMDHVPRPNELVRKAPHALDGLDIVAVLGTDHIGNAVDERAFTASGDPIDALGPDGKAAFPRGGSRATEAQLTPDGLRRSGTPFEPIEVHRDWQRRRRDLSVDTTVLLTPKNPEPVTALEYQSIEKTYGGGSGISKGDKTASSVGVEVGNTVVPVGAAGGNSGTVVRFRALAGGSVTPVDLRWGKGGTADIGSSTEATVKGAVPVKETLVWVDVATDVVSEAKYQGNIDKAGWFDGKEPGRSGTSFTLPKSMLVWATDAQIAAMRGEPQDGPVQGPPSMPAPESVVGGKGVSLGLGAVTSVVDVRDRMPHLHRRLAESLGEQAADALLPKSKHDAKHDNHGMVDRFLANVNRAAGIALNGGQIAPLREEIGRWQGKTYYLTVGADFVDAPRFTGIEHVDKLATADSLSMSTGKSTSSGHTVGSVEALFRPGVNISGKGDPGAATSRTGHGPASGNLQTGGAAGVSLSRNDAERSDSLGHSHKQTAETSGPVASYTGKIQLDLRIERGYGLDENGVETASQPVARDQAAIRDVTLLKLPEESFPAPKGERFGEDGPEAWTEDRPRPKKVTPEQLAEWRTEPGHVALLEPGADKPDGLGYERGDFIAEHYLGDMTAFRERAELAVSRAPGGVVDSRTVADLKAALTLPAVKAGLPEMMRGGFTVPLKDFDLEVHARLPEEQRLSSVSAAVEIEAKSDAQHKSTYTAKSGHSAETSAVPLLGGAGVGHPGGANDLGEGRRNFGSHFASTQTNSLPTGKHESVLSGEQYRSRPKDKVPGLPGTSAEKSKITQVDLHDVEFRFVAKPKPGLFSRSGAGVADLPVTDAFAIRHRPDATRPLPESLTDAATALADAGKAWTAAEKAVEAQQLQQGKGKEPEDASPATKRDEAEATYHEARRVYDEQIVAARAETPIHQAARTAEQAAATAAKEAARAEQAAAAATRAGDAAATAEREGRPAAAEQARTQRAEHEATAHRAAQAARDAAAKAADAVRAIEDTRRPAIMDARHGAQRHAAEIPALATPDRDTATPSAATRTGTDLDGSPATRKPTFALETMRAAARMGVNAAHRATAAAQRAQDSAHTATRHDPEPPPSRTTPDPTPRSSAPRPAAPRSVADVGGFWSENTPETRPSHSRSTDVGPQAAPEVRSVESSRSTGVRFEDTAETRSSGSRSEPTPQRPDPTPEPSTRQDRITGTGSGPEATGAHPIDPSPNRVSLGTFATKADAEGYVREHYPLIPKVNKQHFDSDTPGHRTNCAAAAIQTINTIRDGKAHQAGPSAPVKTEDVERAVGARFRKVDDFDMIDWIMSRPDVPIGSQALVFLNQEDRNGHYISVHKKPEGGDRFRVVYLDGQDGLLADLGTKPSEIGLMQLPGVVRPLPVHALEPPADGRAAAGPAPSKPVSQDDLPPGTVVAASALSEAQRAQLERHGANTVVAKAGGFRELSNFIDAIKRSLDADSPKEFARITGKLAEIDKKMTFSRNTIAEKAGVRVHLLREDGSWSSYGPRSGRPVHLVNLSSEDAPRYAATTQVVHLGRPGIVYPGPTKTMADGKPHVEHRGEFEVETIKGEHYVRVYTAVYDVAEPGSNYKEVHQDRKGHVTPQVPLNKDRKPGSLWVGGGRPLRAVQWVSKYERQQVQERIDAAAQGKAGPSSSVAPLLRSYLVPLAVYQKASEDARGEHIADKDTSQMVDPTGESNQFGMRGDGRDSLQEHALDWSLVTYVPLGTESHPRPNLSGRVESIGDLYNRLGIGEDFDSTALGHLNDPWFSWARQTDGTQVFKGFNNSAPALRGIGNRLMTAHALWQAQKSGAESMDAFHTRQELGPGETETAPPKQPTDADLNTFVNTYTPAAENLNAVTDAIRTQLGASVTAVATAPIPAVWGNVRVAIGEAFAALGKDKAFLKEINGVFKVVPGAPEPKAPGTFAELRALVANGTADGRTWQEAVTEPVARKFTERILADKRFEILDTTNLADPLRTGIQGMLDTFFGDITAGTPNATLLEGASTTANQQTWMDRARVQAVIDQVGERIGHRDHSPLPKTALAVDPVKLAEYFQETLMKDVRKATVDKVLSQNLVDVAPDAQRTMFRDKIGTKIADSLRKLIKPGNGPLGLVEPAAVKRLAADVSAAVAGRVNAVIDNAPLRLITRDELDPVMTTTVPRFATIAYLGALNSMDADRNKFDLDTRTSDLDPYPNEFGRWRVEHTLGYTQKGDPEVFAKHREVGDDLKRTINDVLAKPKHDHSAAYRVVEQLITALDDGVTREHEGIRRKFNEMIKEHNGSAINRAEGEKGEPLFHEHAQMVLNQYFQLTRNDDESKRFISREALAKAILFHDMDKVNSKNLYGDSKAAHDAEPEHRGAVTAMNRHEGLWSSKREFGIAKAIVDADPIGLYLRHREDKKGQQKGHDVTEAYKFIRRVAHQWGPPVDPSATEDGPKTTTVTEQKLKKLAGASALELTKLTGVSARDVKNFFTEVEQYFQADFSSYSTEARYVNPQRPDEGVVPGRKSGFSGLRRVDSDDPEKQNHPDETGAFVFAEGGRRYDYLTYSSDNSDYHSKMEKLRELFERDIRAEDGMPPLSGEGGVSGIGGSRLPAVFQGRDGQGASVRFSRDDVVESDLGRGIAFDRLERVRAWAEDAGRFVPRPSVVRTDDDDEIDIDALLDTAFPQPDPTPPSLEAITVAARVEGERFALPVESADGDADVLVRPPVFAEVLASSPAFQRRYDQAQAPSVRLVSPTGADTAAAEARLADALGDLGYPLQQAAPSAPTADTGQHGWWSGDSEAGADAWQQDPQPDPTRPDQAQSDQTQPEDEYAKEVRRLDETDPRDLYRVLGLPPTATEAEIRAAFDRLAHLMHPALHPDDPRAAERYRNIYDAFMALSNPHSRAGYDAHLRHLAQAGLPWPPIGSDHGHLAVRGGSGGI